VAVDVIQWFRTSGEPALNKESSQRYAARRHEHDVGIVNIKQQLSVIRKLAVEATDKGWLRERRPERRMPLM
jgi:hypothetical protein